MVLRIIKILIASAIIVLLLMWLWGGGFTSVSNFVKTIPNPIDIIWGNATSSYAVRLPWQNAIPQGPDISGLTAQGDVLSGQSAQDQANNSQNQYSATQAQNAQTYGTPSPYAGQVVLSEANATESDVHHEYLELDSRSQSPVGLTGWSLQSVLSGVRVYIPPAAAPFHMGAVNTPLPVALGPGQTAYVVSGPSPIGISFRENRCTGYLAQLQTFDPSLANACPSSSDMAPLTAQNLHEYGSTCMDFARSLPECTFPTTLPSSLTPGCQVYIVNTFTYGSCMNMESAQSDFELDTWRLYLNSPTELWDNTHDIIRLLDGQGKTVSVLTY
jgi:hypothetical protein